MQKIRVTLVQTSLFWENPSQNRFEIEKIIRREYQKTDLIVLPELFTTGFSFRTELAETMQGETANWLKKLASEGNFAITGSVMITENGKFYNRLLFVHPEGKIDFYDKRHLFSFSEEDKFFEKGENKIIIHYKNWRLLPLICYDLRFPVWSRCQNDYDAILYVAAWPSKRIKAWDALLKARAIENQAYCIGTNSTGIDGKQISYCGHSAVYDFEGNQLIFSDKEMEILNITLSKTDLQGARNLFPALADADSFTVN